MVAPIIAGSVRVAKGVARASRNPKQSLRRGRAAVQRPELLRRVQARERSNSQEKVPLSTEGKRTQQLNTKRILQVRKMYGPSLKKAGRYFGIEATTNIKRIRAAAASWMIVAFITPFTLLHFSVWGIAILGLGAESIPVANYVLPGEEIFFVAHGILMIFGFTYMIGALALYLIRGIDCLGGWKTIIFIACLIGHLTPIFNFFPYVFLWCLAVVINQEDVDEN